jgi:hypothetical protein
MSNTLSLVIALFLVFLLLGPSLVGILGSIIESWVRLFDDIQWWRERRRK